MIKSPSATGKAMKKSGLRDAVDAPCKATGATRGGRNVVCFDEHLMFFTDLYDSFHGMRAGKVNTSLPHFFLTSAQIRAARSLMRWTAEDLAAASALSVATIRRAELTENQTALTSANDLAIRRALESAGVEFIDENGGGPGVRLRKRRLPQPPS
jgi:hypothetical protein